MSDEYLQKELKVSNYTDTHLTPENTSGISALILGAYLDDKKKWEDNLKDMGDFMNEKIQEIADIKVALTEQSKFVSFLCKTFKIKTKKEKRLDEIMQEIDKLKVRFEGVIRSPPSQDVYELAIRGNSLFKSR